MERLTGARLTGNDSVVEPDFTAGRLKGRSEKVATASIAKVQCAIGPCAGVRGGKTLTSCESSQLAERARTVVEEVRPVA